MSEFKNMTDNVFHVRNAILTLNACGNPRPSLSELQAELWKSHRMVTSTLLDVLKLMVDEQQLIQFRPSIKDARRYRITACYQLVPPDSTQQ